MRRRYPDEHRGEEHPPALQASQTQLSLPGRSPTSAITSGSSIILPSSVVELVLPHHIASRMRGGAKAGPCRNEELCPNGIPSNELVATAPPSARTTAPCRRCSTRHYNEITVESSIHTQEARVSRTQQIITLSFAFSRMRVREASITRS
ncbi:unnamed protein product [Linum tenue]|uniref:Uncharacterized protein n=1 Tax=Linum tenue TaxID=586396 RepID=A0AAV0N2F3_9ROSI|nr:unnamed protein product [Linum tenue]